MRTEDQEILDPKGPGLLDRLIALALRNQALVLIGFVLLVALGVRAAQRLPVDAVPDVTNVQVQILTDAPGLSPLEVERFVTYPVELAMAGLPRTEEVRSLSRFGLSVVTVVFEEGTDLYFARQLVSERLAEARESIPAGFGEPAMGPISTGLGETFQFEVRGEGWSLMDLRDVLEWQIARRLRSVEGVVEVNAFGGELRTYQAEVRPERLRAYGLLLGDVFEALERNNLTVGGGYLERGREQMLVRGVALAEELDDVRSIVVDTTAEGTPITVGSLGEVRFAPMIRQGAVSRDGRGEAVIGIAMMLYGENPREAVETEAPAKPDRSADEARVLEQLLAINGAMFVIEIVVGWVAQSTGLIADAIDMFADAAVYGLALFAVGGAALRQRRAAAISGVAQGGLAVGVLVEVARRALMGSDPEGPLIMGMAAVALLANVSCMALLATHRTGGVHMKASWIFSTNDVLANLGVLLAGLLVALLGSAVPDLVVGTVIGLVVLTGAVRILRLSRS